MDRSVCWFCQHFHFWSGSPGYSELTPGSSASIECAKGVWTMDLDDEDEDSFREKLSTAATCGKFKARGA